MKLNSLLGALILVIGLGAMTANEARAQTLLLEYNFNSTGSTTTSTGTNAAVGTVAGGATIGTVAGVSGTAGDYAFSNTGATMGGTGGGLQLNNTGYTGTLTSYTLTGWFNSATALSNAARLFDNSGLTLRADTTTPGMLAFTANGLTLFSSAAYTQTNSWEFFAVSVTEAGDNNSASISFYIGDTSTSVSLVSTGTLAIQALPISGGNMGIGNRISGDRAYKGLLDDMRLYGSTSGSASALTLSQLETLRLSDLSPAAVPEPGVTVLMVLGGGLLCVVGYRRVRPLAVRV